MEIYIEYAFLENFFYDGALLSLSLLAMRKKIQWRKLVWSAFCGGVFAILCPLLILPRFFLMLLKLAMGALLCLLAYGRIATRKDVNKYVMTTVLFFCFSFGFGGTLLSVYGFSSIDKAYKTERVPSFFVFLGFIFLCGVAIWLIQCLYKQKRDFQNVYACFLYTKDKKISVDGFFDSGNLARKNGIPICFVSPEIIYLLFGEEIMKGGGQVCDEMCITTLTGRKNISVYLGEIEVKKQKMQTYFAPSENMIGRNYKILLNAACIGETDETD